MRHPVPARLKAYARYRIDFQREVERHIAECRDCAQLVLNDVLDGAETPAKHAAFDDRDSPPVGEIDTAG